MKHTALPRFPRAVTIGLVVFGCLLLGTACVSLCAHQPRPQALQDPRAEASVDRMWTALDHAAWENTGAIRWRMAAGRPVFLWDRERDWIHARYENKSPAVDVYLALGTRLGIALSQATELPETEQSEWLERAYADWANDSFWLIAPFKARDPGTERGWVRAEDGADRVLVSYSSGGVTPGDAYLWRLDEDGTPTSWQMWVQILPIGGIEVHWKDWQRLATGVRVARVREGPMGIQMKMEPLEAAETVGLLTGADPFQTVAERLAGASPQ